MTFANDYTIATPETATTGYCWCNRKEVAPYVEPIPGPTTDQFAAIAKKYDCYIVIGLERMVKFAGGSVLINPDGTIGSYVDTDEIMYGEVDIAKARAKNFANGGNKMTERRPKEYMEMMQNTYLWNPLDFHKPYGYDPIPEGRVSKVFVAQVNPVKGNVAENLEIIRTRVAEAASQGSELIVFPELMLTGLVSGSAARALAEEATGDSVSMQHHIYIQKHRAGPGRQVINPASKLPQPVKEQIDRRDRIFTQDGPQRLQALLLHLSQKRQRKVKIARICESPPLGAFLQPALDPPDGGTGFRVKGQAEKKPHFSLPR